MIHRAEIVTLQLWVAEPYIRNTPHRHQFSPTNHLPRRSERSAGNLWCAGIRYLRLSMKPWSGCVLTTNEPVTAQVFLYTLCSLWQRLWQWGKNRGDQEGNKSRKSLLYMAPRDGRIWALEISGTSIRWRQYSAFLNMQGKYQESVKRGFKLVLSYSLSKGFSLW